MKLICACPCNRIDDSASFAPILGRCICGYDGEFLDRIHTEVQSNDASGCSVGVIIDADTVHSIVVLLGTAAGNGHLSAVSAVSAIGTDGNRLFEADQRHPRLQ